MSIRRKKKPAANPINYFERDLAARAARERWADLGAEKFWSEQRAAQGYAASQIFGPTQTERDADVLRELRLSALRDRIRIVDHETLENM